MFRDVEKAIQVLGNPTKAVLQQKYFKTGKGEYGEGDVFLGLTVPQSRSIAKKFKMLSLENVEMLLGSKFHEYRQIGLMILVLQFKRADNALQRKIVRFYLAHTKAINNWDLVDGSAGYILGEWLYALKDPEQTSRVLKKLARSRNIWERRIAVLATFAFIYHGEDSFTYEIVQLLLEDKHDLIQKAIGWMLREAGKRVSLVQEKEFLIKHHKIMGRTALHYSIERFPKSLRLQYLHGQV